MQDRIVLLCKKPGKTSFSSLFTVKHALDTQKVGHTGTLDSFASGLLVVCTGALTRLASKITGFDKAYEAVIKFGEETDTLECTGKIVGTAPLPDKEAFVKSVESFRGELDQVPPVFSALHVDGKRASDMIRSGSEVQLESRKITVYDSKILEIKETEDGKIQYARVYFSVSKGTYIRSLARDIGLKCNSRAHLTGLLRTRIGSFKLEDSCGFTPNEIFNIETAILQAEKTVQIENENKQKAEEIKNLRKQNPKVKVERPKKEISPDELKLQEQVRENALFMNEEIAENCGFASIYLKKDSEEWFYNGGKLQSKMFNVSPLTLQEEYAAVFSEDKSFKGLLQKNENGYFEYAFVVH